MNSTPIKSYQSKVINEHQMASPTKQNVNSSTKSQTSQSAMNTATVQKLTKDDSIVGRLKSTAADSPAGSAVAGAVLGAAYGIPGLGAAAGAVISSKCDK